MLNTQIHREYSFLFSVLEPSGWGEDLETIAAGFQLPSGLSLTWRLGRKARSLLGTPGSHHSAHPVPPGPEGMFHRRQMQSCWPEQGHVSPPQPQPQPLCGQNPLGEKWGGDSG